MAKIKQPKILFFIDGPVPNAANKREALSFTAKGACVVFRNARFTKDDVSREENTAAVLGDPDIIPAIYKTNILSPDEAIAKYVELMDADAKAATNKTATGEEDNMGSHTLPSMAQIPVAAAFRQPGGPTQAAPIQAAPASPAPATGSEYTPPAQTGAQGFQPGSFVPGQPQGGAPAQTGAFDPNNVPKV